MKTKAFDELARQFKFNTYSTRDYKVEQKKNGEKYQ